MIRPPYLARVAVGAVVFALEETRKLPTTAISLPMNAVSQMLQTTMHAQQFITSLAIKGDEALEPLVGRSVEQPAWATFDEDESDSVPTNGHAPDTDRSADGNDAGRTVTAEPGPVVPETADADQPEQAGVIDRIDYPSLTLAQLRARLRYLSVEDLTALLAFEERELARAPFLTMLTNRIATTTAT